MYNDDDHWDCPTCCKPMPPEDDRICPCCGMRVSHHISVESLCRITREWQAKADAAELENAKLKSEIDLWRSEAQRWREQVLRHQTWPHDTNPFDSQDHDNDSKTYT